MFNKGYGFIFSPCGTTLKVANQICSSIDVELSIYNTVDKNSLDEINVGNSDVCVFAAPVYAGRLPQYYVEKIKELKGNGALAIPVVTYGNREYDDALLELVDILHANDFKVVGAGAFIAEHSIFNKVAAGRPDNKDLAIIDEFTNKCLSLGSGVDLNTVEKLEVSGNRPYKKAGSVPLKPKTKSSCKECGKCAVICPTSSILKEQLSKTNNDTCISCGACISVCPSNSRSYSGLTYLSAEKVFVAANSKYKQPELFYINKL